MSRGRSEAQSWDHGRDLRQDVLNERPIPARRAQRDLWPPVPVLARIVWSDDGEQWIEATSATFAVRGVHVALLDPRRRAAWVWLAWSDVYRITTDRSPLV